MKVVQFGEYGTPDVLYVGDVDLPVAGPGQVQIQVAAAGVNPADYKWRLGFFQSFMPLQLPHVLGYDVAGVVTAVGEGVTQFALGDRIVASLRGGGYAEYAVAQEKDAALIPDGFDFVQAAALPCASLTGVELIEEGIAPAKGETVLVTGATGAVGRFALRAAAALGARVIAAVRPEYFDEAKALGADEMISLEGDDPAGLRFDHVADTVGGADVSRLCRHLAPGGKIISVATAPIDPEGLAATPQFFGYHPDGVRLARIVADVASGKMTMPVARTFPLASADEAHRFIEKGGTKGKVVLEP